MVDDWCETDAQATAVARLANAAGALVVSVEYRLGPEHMFPAAVVDADPEGLWLAGRINEANLARSREAWSLVDAGYVPIDWHLDFKSGYRWSESTWYADVPYGHLPGVEAGRHHGAAAASERDPGLRLRRGHEPPG